MKKLILLFLLTISIGAKAQYYTYIEKSVDTTLTTPNFTLLRDTAKGSVYEIGGYCNFRIPGAYIAITCNYIDDNGTAQSAPLYVFGGGSTVYTGNNRFLKFEISVKTGTVIYITGAWKSGPMVTNIHTGYNYRNMR